MLVESWNPESPDVEATLGFLKRCFGSGWDNELYQWYLARPFSGRAPDRLVIREGESVVAGSAVNYRQLRMADGSIRDIGIATASWTVPEARGKGLFTRMMQASSVRAADNGCQYLLAFVTADNASRNALERCGATMVASSYVVSSDRLIVADASDATPVEYVNPSPDDLFLATGESGRVRFYYDSSADWAEQHMLRPHPAEVVRVGSHHAIVEKTTDTDRLQWTSAGVTDRPGVASALAIRAAANGRNFFMYGTGELAALLAPAAGLIARQGFIACLTTANADAMPAVELAAAWDIQSGDRM